MWVDPGLVSGYAFYDYISRNFGCGEESLTGLGERLRALATSLPPWDLAVGCEDYLNAGRGRGTPRYSYAVMGMVEWLAHDYAFTQLPAVPSGMRKLGSVNKLKKLGWYRMTKGGHSADASRHLLSDMLRNHRQRALPEEVHRILFADDGPADTLPT